MTAYCLDTSYLLRLLTQTPDSQVPSALEFYHESSRAKNTLSVSDLVLSECYYALQYHFDYSKVDALASLRALAKDESIQVTPAASEVLQLRNLSKLKPGFIDRIIHSDGHSKNQTLVTFEKAAKKLPDTLVLSAKNSN